jgi:Holliday junction resolvase
VAEGVRQHEKYGVLRTWTEEEDRILRELYPTTDTEELAQRLGRSRHAVNRRAASLGIRKDPEFVRLVKTLSWRKGKKKEMLWTKEEEEELRRLYLEEGLPVEEIARRLNRTESAIRNRVRFLGIYRSGAHPNEVGDRGEVLAEEYFKERGWKVLKKGTRVASYDFIVEADGIRFAVNVKNSSTGNVAISTRNLRRLAECSEGRPAFLVFDERENVYFVPIAFIDFRTRDFAVGENKV